ncbi:hypothetical protein [Flavobacterium chungangense]|uniref:hypothetical protein n=1 Tax=Flavobacterium chungangense TaxID=554283 RepID=UPI000A4E47EA|nr:hypothetical protein [Flavobacterium chungangense]
MSKRFLEVDEVNDSFKSEETIFLFTDDDAEEKKNTEEENEEETKIDKGGKVDV